MATAAPTNTGGGQVREMNPAFQNGNNPNTGQSSAPAQQLPKYDASGGFIAGGNYYGPNSIQAQNSHIYGNQSGIIPNPNAVTSPVIGATDYGKTTPGIQPNTPPNAGVYNGINSGILSSYYNTDGSPKNNLVDVNNQNQSNTQNDFLTKAMAAFNDKPSESSLYQQAQNEIGILQKQQAVNDLTGQLGSIQAQGQANQQSVVGQGRGIPDAIIGGQQAEISRETAIASLPVAAQLSAAQGNLTMAQQHLDTLFKIKSDDAKANYDFKINLLTSVKDFATTQEDKQLAAAQQKATQQHADQQTNIATAAGWAKSAMESLQPKLSAQISMLNPASPTFKTDMAKLQSQINPSNTPDNQYKIMQTRELAQKISDAKKATDLAGLLSPVPILKDGTYDTVAQETLLGQMNPRDAAIVKEVGNYQMDISKVTSLKGGEREALAAKVALVYPGFDMSKYATNAAYKKSLTSGNIYNGIVSANKAISHLSTFINDVTNIDNGSISSGLNSLQNSVSSSNPLYPNRVKLQTNLSNATTEASGLKDELAKFFKGTGSTDVKSIDDWSKNLDVNSTPGQLKGTTQGAIDLLAGQLDVMSQQYKQTLGQAPGDTFLQPQTVQKLSDLKNQGYKVDIPNVYYTDKTAFEKYGGGNAEKYTAAYNTLKANNKPTTPENILQVAQIL